MTSCILNICHGAISLGIVEVNAIIKGGDSSPDLTALRGLKSRIGVELGEDVLGVECDHLSERQVEHEAPDVSVVGGVATEMSVQSSHRVIVETVIGKTISCDESLNGVSACGSIIIIS